jgi:hypothetical protein
MGKTGLGTIYHDLAAVELVLNGGEHQFAATRSERGGGRFRSVRVSGGKAQNQVAAAGTAALRRRFGWI